MYAFVVLKVEATQARQIVVDHLRCWFRTLVWYDDIYYVMEIFAICLTYNSPAETSLTTCIWSIHGYWGLDRPEKVAHA